MQPETFLTLLGLAFVASWTPGPNNSLLASSGATFGIRATLPMILGIITGYPVLITLVGLGLAEAFQQSPLFAAVLHWVGAGLLLWIAWKIATSVAPDTTGKPGRPITYLQSVTFQTVNPKGWAVAIAVTSQYVVGDNANMIAFIIGGAFFFAGLTSTFAWTLFGRAIGRLLQTPQRLMWFNRAMALLIVGFLIVLLMDS